MRVSEALRFEHTIMMTMMKKTGKWVNEWRKCCTIPQTDAIFNHIGLKITPNWVCFYTYEKNISRK